MNALAGAVTLRKCLAYTGEKGIKAVVVGPDSSETENKDNKLAFF